MIKKILIGIILNSAALYGVTLLLPQQIQYSGGVAFFTIGGITMGLLNGIVKPLLKLFTLPLQIITLGLSLIIINGIIFWLFDVIIDTIMIEGVRLEVTGLKTYFFGGFLFGFINWAEHLLIHKN